METIIIPELITVSYLKRTACVIRDQSNPRDLNLKHWLTPLIHL